MPYSKAFSITRCSYVVLKFELFKEISDTTVSSLCVLLREVVFIQLVVLDIRRRLTSCLLSSKLTAVGNNSSISIYSKYLLTKRVKGLLFTEPGI